MKKQSKKFKVFRASAGLGLRALRDFKKSEELIEYTGPRISTKNADAKPNRYLFQLNDKHYIDGSPRSNLARYIIIPAGRTPRRLSAMMKSASPSRRSGRSRPVRKSPTTMAGNTSRNISPRSDVDA